MHNGPSFNTRSRKGFTLIELLVVISIVALLISILLPSLAAAKRAGMLIRCASNFRQLGIGLKVYTDQFNHKYPPAPANVFWSGPIYDTRAGDDGSTDGRVNFLEICGGKPGDLLWCPLMFMKGPTYDGVDPWTQHYISCSGTVCYQAAGILLYFLVPDSWDWSHSGQPDINGDNAPDRPSVPDDPRATVASDHSWYDPAQCSANAETTVCWTVHNNQPWPPGSSQTVKDTNLLFGDGHVVTRLRVQNWVARPGGNLSMY